MMPGYPQGLAPSPAPEAPRTRDDLTRLADVLGVPVPFVPPGAEGRDEAIRQVADLVTVFAGIGNPAARRTCLAFVRAMARS